MTGTPPGTTPVGVGVGARPSGARPSGEWAEVVRAAYAEVRTPLWRALAAWSGSADVADEAVAEAFAQLLRRGAEVRDPKAWAWRSAFRLAAGDLKRRRLAAGPGTDGLDLLAGRPDRLPEEALDLVRALAQLSDQQRRCVALVDVAGHTAPSAAAVLGTTAATVRVQLMRARRHLRTLLAEPNVGHGPASGSETENPIHPPTETAGAPAPRRGDHPEETP